MRPCPVCESPVSGRTCEVCGRELDIHPVAAASAGALEGLEPTHLPPARVLGLALDPAPDLERTARDDVPEVPGDPLLGWEATRLLGGPDVPAGGLEALDRGRSDGPADAPTPVPVAVTCRYCRHIQTTGLFCDRCGMHLPWKAPQARAPEAAQTQLSRCPRCGERSPPEMNRCGACGALLRVED